jgi:4-hydroxy-tetrahydrodipicolinate synthase
MLAGFHGTISVTANAAPELMARMCTAALAGDAALAAELDAGLAPLHRALFVEPNPIPIKWALAELGLAQPGIRLPLVPLDPAHHETVRAALRQAGLL